MSSVDSSSYISQLEEELNLMRRLVCELTNSMKSTKPDPDQYRDDKVHVHQDIGCIKQKYRKPYEVLECQECVPIHCEARCDKLGCTECIQFKCDNPLCRICKPSHESWCD